MSKTKGVRIGGRSAWVLDNSHDVVVARMVEVAQERGGIDADTIGEWKLCASVPDIALHHDEPSEPSLSDILVGARDLVENHGDVHPQDLRDWRLLDGISVSNGFLRYEVLPVEALLDVVDGFADLVAGTLAPDPPGTWWFLGVPGGRRTIAMRTDRP